MSKTKEDVEFANAAKEVVAAMLGIFGIETEASVSARNKAEGEEREGVGAVSERKEKLRWYLNESIRLQKESEKLEEQSQEYLDIVDHSFTEAQRDAIWADAGHGLSSVERLTKAVEEMGIEEEVSK